MAPPSVSRRKSSKGTMIITLKLSPKSLAKFRAASPIKEESPAKDSASSTTSNTIPVVTTSHGEPPSESTSNTPADNGTPTPSSMPPPTEGVKKKGVKRSAAALGPDGTPKIRGKPGPKKKARLEDGTIDHSTAPKAANATAATHRLGPKANQGAINAGLRALDRSGKACRKWEKGGFKLKSFTGVIWEIPRWTAPPKLKVEKRSEDPASGESSKENKDNSQIESEKSNNEAEVEVASAASQNISSRAPSVPSADSAPAAPAATVVVAAPA